MSGFDLRYANETRRGPFSFRRCLTRSSVDSKVVVYWSRWTIKLNLQTLKSKLKIICFSTFLKSEMAKFRYGVVLDICFWLGWSWMISCWWSENDLNGNNRLLVKPTLHHDRTRNPLNSFILPFLTVGATSGATNKTVNNLYDRKLDIKTKISASWW